MTIFKKSQISVCNHCEGSTTFSPSHLNNERNNSSFSPQLGTIGEIVATGQSMSMKDLLNFTSRAAMAAGFYTSKHAVDEELYTSPTAEQEEDANAVASAQHSSVNSTSLMGFVRTFCVARGLPVPTDLIREVEQVMFLVAILDGVENYLAACAAILQYISSHTKGAVTVMVYDLMCETLNVYQTQSGELEYDTNDELQIKKSQSMFSVMQQMKDNWDTVKHNGLFKHVSKVLGILVNVGVCELTDVTFSVKGFKLLAPELEVVQADAFDLMDAVLASATFFLTSAEAAKNSGSLRPFLTGSGELATLDERYVRVVSEWDLVKNGNLEKETGRTDAEFNKEMIFVMESFRVLGLKLKGPEKTIVQGKYIRLATMRNDFLVYKVNSGIRKAPYAIELYGRSKQGKTTLCDQVLDVLLTSAGLSIEKSDRCSLNASDKFMSNWTTDKTVLIIDDLANEKPMFVERPPTRAIIDVCNNNPFTANMADLGAKGKVFVEPHLVVVTTNKKSLDAHTYSNCPYSIQRRMDVVITVKAKDKYQVLHDGATQGIDKRLVNKSFTTDSGGTSQFNEDLWELTIERALEPTTLEATATYAVIKWKGKELRDVSFKTAVNYLVEDFASHRESQVQLIQNSKKRVLHLCKVDGCKQVRGLCQIHHSVQMGKLYAEESRYELSTNPVGAIVAEGLNEILGTASKDFSMFHRWFHVSAEKTLTFGMTTAAYMFLKKWDWMCVLPTSLVKSPVFLNAMLLNNPREIGRRIKVRSAKNWLVWAAYCAFSAYHIRKPRELIASVAIPTCYAAFRQVTMAGICCEMYQKDLVKRNSLDTIARIYRDDIAAKVTKAAGATATLYLLLKAFRLMRSTYAEQGALNPQSAIEVAARDVEHNPWSPTGICAMPQPISDESRTTTHDNLSKTVEKNLMFVQMSIKGVEYGANALFLTSNVVMLPHHYFKDGVEDIPVTFYKCNPFQCGGKFCARLSLTASVLIPGTDLRICYCPTGGSYKNIIKFFPTAPMSRHGFKMMYRNIKGETTTNAGVACPGMVTTYKSFYGGYYENLTEPTFEGLCGAALVSDTRGCSISGIHLGGKEGEKSGCYGVATQTELHSAMSILSKIQGVLISGKAEKFANQSYGQTLVVSAPAHPKSVTRYLPHESQIVYYGKTLGMTSSHSRVTVTPISPFVSEVCGRPNIYCAPKMQPEYYGWQKCLENMSHPGKPFEHKLLQRSMNDYVGPLLTIFKRKELWGDIRPLTDIENINGIPGKKFIDGIKMYTAIGFPLVGRKDKYTLDLVPTEEYPHLKTFKPQIWEEIERHFELYRQGERAFPVTKACKKDEVLAKADKCRIFYSNPISLTFAIRKWFLPLIRILQMNPLVSECAVGINCHGPEWDELYTHMLHHGKERLFAGDYSKYDQKIPSQLLLASFRILIDCARECNYSEEDITCMEALSGDVVFALIAYNGDLIGLTEGSHISGNSLTVILNGICGSLNLRNYFYTQYPGLKEFRKYVSMVTYGDDNGGSVSRKCPKFNVKGCSEYLGKYGQTYTMPDKDSELLPYVEESSFEFLKRKNVYHKAMKCSVGALSEDSCFKMLHCVVREKNSPNTMDEVCAANIETALREWFNHGPIHFEKRRMEMVDVARKAGITHLCTELHDTYEDRITKWNLIYRK